MKNHGSREPTECQRSATSLVVYAGKAKGGKEDRKPEWILDSEAQTLSGWKTSLTTKKPKSQRTLTSTKTK